MLARSLKTCLSKHARRSRVMSRWRARCELWARLLFLCKGMGKVMMSQSPNSSSDLGFEAELLTVHINGLLVKWGASKPLRVGLHASSVLVPESEWCTRQHVLAGVFPRRAEPPKS